MELTVNMSNPPEKHQLLERLRSLQGEYRVDILRHRKRRSDRQNRYYWPCFVQVFGDFLRAQGEEITDDEVHTLFKAKFLRTTVVNRDTGEVVGQKIRSTTDLDTEEFNDYLENVAKWLAENVGIIVPPPDVYRVSEPAPPTRSRTTLGGVI